jgi:hypothetical protein
VMAKQKAALKKIMDERSKEITQDRPGKCKKIRAIHQRNRVYYVVSGLPFKAGPSSLLPRDIPGIQLTGFKAGHEPCEKSKISQEAFNAQLRDIVDAVKNRKV